MGQISAIQPTLLYDLEGLDTVASKQKAGDFEGFFSKNEYSFKKKPDLDTQDTERLDPSLLYLSPRVLCPAKPLQSLCDSQSPGLLEGLAFAPSVEPKPVNPDGLLRVRGAYECSDAQGQPMIDKGLGPTKEHHPFLEYKEATVCPFQNAEATTPVLHAEKSKTLDLSCLQNDLDPGYCKQVESPPRAEPILHPKNDAISLNNPYPKDTGTDTLSSVIEEKIGIGSFFSQQASSSLGFKDTLSQAAPCRDAIQEDSVKFQASPEPLDTDQAGSDRVKVQSKASISLNSTSIYHPKENSHSSYKGPSIKKSLSVTARPHPAESLGENEILRRPSPKLSSALNLKDMHQEAMQEKDKDRSVVTSIQERLEATVVVSPDVYRLDLQESQEASTDQKIQTDLVGLIADYFDKMKAEGRSWTRLSLDLGQNKKIQLLLRLQGETMGVRLQDAPPDIKPLLLQDWMRLSRLASQKGLRLEVPLFTTTTTPLIHS